MNAKCQVNSVNSNYQTANSRVFFDVKSEYMISDILQGYPPNRKRKIIDSQVPAGRGYVSSLQSKLHFIIHNPNTSMSGICIYIYIVIYIYIYFQI